MKVLIKISNKDMDKVQYSNGSILVNGIEVICYPNNDGGFWYFHPATREIIEVEG